MTFNPIDCWDCPVPVLVVVLGLVMGIGLLAAGLVFRRRRNLPDRLGGFLLLVLVAIWYFILLRGITRLGLIWTWSWYRSASDIPWHVDRRADFALVAIWLCISASLVWSLGWKRRAVA